MAVVLRDDATALGIALHGNVVAHRVAADDGGACVNAFTTKVTLDAQCGVDDALDVFLGIVCLLQVGVLGECLVNGDAQLVADHLADTVAHAVGIIKHARSVADGVFRLQLAEGDNACNMIFAIELANVLDDVLTMLIVEVDVDIGHLHAFGVQEAFKHQAVLDGVEVGDAHGVRAQRTSSRTTARANTDAMLARPADVFLNDQEVCREALLDDDVRFVFVLLFDRLLFAGVVGDGDVAPIGAVTMLEAFLAFLAEQHLLGVALG